MKNIVIILVIISISFITCKKNTEEESPNKPTPVVPSLKWEQNEIDTIMHGDTSEGLRIYLTTSYSDSLVLRAQSKNVVPDSNDVVLMTLINRMFAALTSTSGVGIAAPQVGINRNVVWIKRQDKPGRPFEVYLNLRIVMTSIMTINFNGDGCLSIPGISGKTERYRAIGIEYDLLDGSHHSEVIDGYSMSQFTAVCFQHEIDHVNGVLFIDRLVD